MYTSYTSLFTGIAISSLLILIIGIFIVKVTPFQYIRMMCLFTVCGLLIFRLLFPLEFNFTKSINSSYFLPPILHFLAIPIMSLIGIEWRIYHILLILWLLGSIYHLVTLFQYRKKFYTYIKTLPHYDSPIAKNILQNITNSHIRSVQFELKVSSIFSTPAIYGIKNPIIILPTIEFSEDELFFILSHEITHYYNRDLLTKLLFDIFQCICWCNPFVSILNRQIARLLELRADETVTDTLSQHDRICYLECMLRIAKFQNSFSNHYALTFHTSNTTMLEQRFQLILNKGKHGECRRHFVSLIFILVFVCILGASYVYNFAPYSILPEHAKDTFTISADDSFLLETTKGYDLYINTQYICTIESVDETFENLLIYSNLNEVPNELY